MRNLAAVLLAILLAFSACAFVASAVRPDNPGIPDSNPVFDGDDAPPEVLPTDQTDETPAADNAPNAIGDEGPQIDWLPDL